MTSEQARAELEHALDEVVVAVGVGNRTVHRPLGEGAACGGDFGTDRSEVSHFTSFSVPRGDYTNGQVNERLAGIASGLDYEFVSRDRPRRWTIRRSLSGGQKDYFSVRVQPQPTGEVLVIGTTPCLPNAHG